MTRGVATRDAQVGNRRRLECEAAHGQHVPALARVLLRIADMKKSSRRKLSLHRESLRVLTHDRLARIAGGTEFNFGPPKRGASPNDIDILPRTNAWTTGIEYVC